MAVEFKTSMTKAELLEVAAVNGIAADDSMTKAAIIAVLEAGTPESATEGAENAVESGGAAPEGNNTTTEENAAEVKAEGAQARAAAEPPEQDAQEAPEGYDLFVYAGPTLPRGQLKENTVFNGTYPDVLAYLAGAIEEYPQAARLIVPAGKLAAFAVKVRTPGNIAHKYYNDIVSAMHGNKEV